MPEHIRGSRTQEAAKKEKTSSSTSFQKSAGFRAPESDAASLLHTLGQFPIHAPGQTLQTKLEINAPGDRYEAEADRTAEQVVAQIAASAHSPASAPLPPPSLSLSTLPSRTGENRTQRASENSPLAPGSSAEAQLQQARGGGASLPDSVRVPMENAFGADFSGVKIHADSSANTLSRSLAARAFTTGPDIFFKSGAYDPGSAGGQKLLAHELTHVVQQTGARPIQCKADTVSSQPNALARILSSAPEGLLQRDDDKEFPAPSNSWSSYLDPNAYLWSTLESLGIRLSAMDQRESPIKSKLKEIWQGKSATDIDLAGVQIKAGDLTIELNALTLQGLQVTIEGMKTVKKVEIGRLAVKTLSVTQPSDGPVPNSVRLALEAKQFEMFSASGNIGEVFSLPTMIGKSIAQYFGSAPPGAQEKAAIAQGIQSSMAKVARLKLGSLNAVFLPNSTWSGMQIKEYGELDLKGLHIEGGDPHRPYAQIAALGVASIDAKGDGKEIQGTAALNDIKIEPEKLQASIGSTTVLGAHGKMGESGGDVANLSSGPILARINADASQTVRANDFSMLSASGKTESAQGKADELKVGELAARRKADGGITVGMGDFSAKNVSGGSGASHGSASSIALGSARAKMQDGSKKASLNALRADNVAAHTTTQDISMKRMEANGVRMRQEVAEKVKLLPVGAVVQQEKHVAASAASARFTGLHITTLAKDNAATIASLEKQIQEHRKELGAYQDVVNASKIEKKPSRENQAYIDRLKEGIAEHQKQIAAWEAQILGLRNNLPVYGQMEELEARIRETEQQLSLERNKKGKGDADLIKHLEKTQQQLLLQVDKLLHSTSTTSYSVEKLDIQNAKLAGPTGEATDRNKIKFTGGVLAEGVGLENPMQETLVKITSVEVQLDANGNGGLRIRAEGTGRDVESKSGAMGTVFDVINKLTLLDVPVNGYKAKLDSVNMEFRGVIGKGVQFTARQVMKHIKVDSEILTGRLMINIPFAGPMMHGDTGLVPGGKHKSDPGGKRGAIDLLAYVEDLLKNMK